MILKRIILLISLYLLFFNVSRADDVLFTPADKQIYEKYITEYSNQSDKPINEIIIATAQYFQGRPYVASTLEISEKETLVINLREFDCTTFVENCIALSLVLQSKDYSFENYTRILKSIRYRQGEVNGYTSRLHYVSDWIYENEKQGLLKNISLSVGGENVDKGINFMTKNSHLYKHLKNNDSNIAEMLKIESNITNRRLYEILPTERIQTNQEKIESGNIIVFATAIAGLDYSHIGIAYWQNNELHFIHASSKYKKVIIEPRTLSNYCKDSSKCIGVSVLEVK